MTLTIRSPYAVRPLGSNRISPYSGPRATRQPAFSSSELVKPSSPPLTLTHAANLLNTYHHFNEYNGQGDLTKQVVLNASKSLEGMSGKLWHRMYPQGYPPPPIGEALEKTLNNSTLGVLEEVSDLQYELIGLIAHKRGLIPQHWIDHVDTTLKANPGISVLDLIPRLTEDLKQNKPLVRHAKDLSKLVYGARDKTDKDITATRMVLTGIRYSQLGYASAGKTGHVPEKDLIHQLHGELAEMVSNIPLLDKSDFQTLLSEKNLEIQHHPHKASNLRKDPQLTHHLATTLHHIDQHQAQLIAKNFQATQNHLVGILQQTLGLKSLTNREILKLMDDYYLRKHILRQEFNLVRPDLDRETRKKMTKLFEAMSEAELIARAQALAAARQGNNVSPAQSVKVNTSQVVFA